MLKIEFGRVGAALIDAFGQVVGSRVYQSNPLVASEHSPTELGRSFRAEPRGPVLERLGG